jgi:hypothetical protein
MQHRTARIRTPAVDEHRWQPEPGTETRVTI